MTETNDTPARYFPMALGDAHVELSTDGGVTAFARLDATSANFSGDANGNGQLEVGETWAWTFTTTPLVDTTLTATGFGTGAAWSHRDLPRRSRRTQRVSRRRDTNNDTNTTPPTTTPPTTAPPGTVPLTPSLPATGASSSSVESALAGVAFLAVGLALVVVSRRRPPAHRTR